MLDPNIPKTGAVRRKLLLGVLSSPATLFPFVGGVTALFGSWALDARPDLGVLAAFVGVLGAAGAFVTQLVLGGEKRAKAAIDEVREETRRNEERRLDTLEQQLTADGDARTEGALRDLRSLAEALARLSETDEGKLPSPMVVSIRADAAALFAQCVRSLERTLELWHTARSMATKAARAPILEKRERLLQDVFESIRHMGRLLVSMQELESGEGGGSELARIRHELDENLAVAKRVDERLRAFDRELDAQSAE